VEMFEEKSQENDNLTPASGTSVYTQTDPTIHAGRGVLRGVIMDSEHGWIKLHRKITEWEWYDDHITFKVFVHLLLTVNHKIKKWKGIEIKRGQLVISTHKLPKKLNIGRQQLRTALSRLESTGEINLKSTQSFTIITICNYNDYQDCPQIPNPEHNPQLTHDQPTANPQLTLTKESKEHKERKKIKKFIPPTLPEWISYCKEFGFSHIASKSFHGYAENNWCKSNGAKIINWKQTLQHVWFDEQKNPAPKSPSNDIVPDDYDGRQFIPILRAARAAELKEMGKS